ncbi:hypothetical protein FHL15_011001 [Xylaria flabelliformis]|uniref:GMP synthase [glutamine-hydrolyzing] n=1 Tax=Xylaria flabelliformis TaxID=2512241 RepID=A0A553HJK5_9PEZI|nr:hypothetical protein FHL15_011001 [Xylaria flabelliformis]
MGDITAEAAAPHSTFDLADLNWTPAGIVLSGVVDPAIFDLGVPILGICYGCQLLAWLINDKNVARGEAREYGETDLNIHKVGDSNGADRLFEGFGVLQFNFRVVFMSHFDKLVQLPEGFVTIASTKNTTYAGIAHQSKPIFGIQLHPEISHTNRGTDILANFAIKICKARPNWEMGNFTEKEIIRIRKLVGDKAQVIGAVSGGVDSTVAARLMKEAIGDRFHAILVDTGLMRLDECQQVKETLQEHLGINLTIVDGAELFLGRLAGVVEPETKRKIIGETFIDLFEKEAIRIEEEAKETPRAGKVEWFLQGTLYADLIESLSFKGPSATIKSHHNVGGLPARMQVSLPLINRRQQAQLKLIEPLREVCLFFEEALFEIVANQHSQLFKDEVRAFGRQLGIHEDLVMRHPFPGPGIAIRILGEVTPERVEIVRKADHIFISMIKEAGIYDQMSQAYAALDTNRAVGVMGDSRVYGMICILRAVTSVDFMSAEPFEFPFQLLKNICRRIVNEVDGITRVVYDCTSKPPGYTEASAMNICAFPYCA